MVGCTIEGVSLVRASEDELRQIYAAWLQYSVVVIKKQKLTPSDQLKFASYFGSLCLWGGLDLAETLLGGAFAQSFFNNLNAVLFWLFGFYANGAGLGWAFYFAHFCIADHRICVGGKDRTDTRDCGFFGLFGYSIGAQ